jgi:hypothetical protein
MRRRDLLSGGTLGALLGSAVVPASAAGQASGQASDRAIDRVAEAIGDLRAELRDQRQFNEIAPIRAAQKTYMRSNGKLPDFIEVGADLWFQVYDWHVRWQHPIEESRDAQGRLMIAMNGTLVILRADALGNFMGLPYDAR